MRMSKFRPMWANAEAGAAGAAGAGAADAGAADAGAAGAGAAGAGAAGAGAGAGAGAAGAGAAGAGAAGAGAAPAPFYSTLPTDWREQLAGTDEATLNELKRVNDMPHLITRFKDLRKMVSEGIAKGALPDNATPEQIAEYRKAKGIPEKADGYFAALDPKLELGDTDRALMAPVFDAAHKHNLSAPQVAELVNAHLQARNAEVERVEQQHGIDAQATTEKLKAQWGSDYTTNLNLVQAFITANFPGDTHDLIKNAVLPNGKALMNEPTIVMALAAAQRQINPAATLVPSGGNDKVQLSDRKQQLEKMMGEPGWHTNTAARKEYMDIVDALDTLAKRGVK